MHSRMRRSALARARDGDLAALGVLLHSFRPYVRVLVHELWPKALHARGDDSDLIQDAFLEVHRVFPEFRGSTMAEFVCWLRRIVLRVAQRRVRRERSDGRTPEREHTEDEMLAQLTASELSPAARAERSEQVDLLTAALALLSDDMQQVVLARHVDELPHAVIAERLGRSEAAVRVLYVRALDRLRHLLPRS